MKNKSGEPILKIMNRRVWKQVKVKETQTVEVKQEVDFIDRYTRHW